MRAALVAFVVLASAVAAAGQSRAPGDTRDMPTPSIGLPLPHIGLPLPPMGLPLPPMGLPPERVARPERLERSERSQRSERSVFVFFPSYVWPYVPAASFAPAPSPAPSPKRATGRLRLSLHSGVDPQIFVDGYYMGLFSDVAGELTLDVGAHVVELREEGFENARLDVKIPLDDVITYDVDLKWIAAALAPAAPSALEAAPIPSPTTIYMIPGCYVGNVLPQEAGLPAGCDVNRAIAFPSRP